jgi:hypothetical protein
MSAQISQIGQLRRTKVSELTSATATVTKQVYVLRRTKNYWRVASDHPPLNIFGPKTIPQLNEIITALETDEQVKVAVFDCAVEGFFLTHYDFLAPIEDITRLLRGPAGLQPLPGMLVRLSHSELDAFVESLPTHITSFDKRAIAETKHFTDVASLPPDFEIAPSGYVLPPRSCGRPRKRESRTLMELGFQKPGDVAERLGYYVGQLGRAM